MITRDKIFINGEWVFPTGDGAVNEVINPATEDIGAKVVRSSAADVGRAVSAAHAAFQEWGYAPVGERVALFQRLADVAERRAEEITRTIVTEIGHPVSLARVNQTQAGIADIRMLGEYLPDIRWTEELDSTLVRRVPAGVVSAITSWNGPLRSIALKAGAAMAAGCTVVLKGSEVAPSTSFIFAEMVEEAGFPAGVFNLVSGAGRDIGEAMTTHPLVELVSITGSVRAGSRVMELASQSIKRVSLELGGKSANVILDDADLHTALAVGIDDAFRSSGQVCGALSRVLVPRGRVAEAEEIVAAKVGTFVVGDPTDPKTTLGPLASSDARDRVRGYIQAGLDEGLRLVAGGLGAPEGFPRGYYVRPTVFTGDNSSALAQEEIFGPVVIIVPFDGDQDAINIANDSAFGLAGGVWSADPERAFRVATRLRAGRVRINGSPVDKRAPHGGFKQSGIGREQGRIGIEEFLEYQSVSQ